MKWIVVSDSHGHTDRLEKIKAENKDAKGFIHCGDYEDDDLTLNGFICVRGNNDYYTSSPIERIVELNDHYKAYVTHSHLVYVFERENSLVQKAKEKGCNIVLFGHTHIPTLRQIDGIYLVNPGSLYYNRNGSHISYCEIELEADQIKIRLKPYEEKYKK